MAMFKIGEQTLSGLASVVKTNTGSVSVKPSEMPDKIANIRDSLFNALMNNTISQEAFNTICATSKTIPYTHSQYVTEINAPEATAIQGSGIYMARGVQRAIIPKVATIPAGVFDTALQEISVGTSGATVNIADNAFGQCINLTSFNRANGAVLNLGNDVFKGCLSLKSLELINDNILLCDLYNTGIEELTLRNIDTAGSGMGFNPDQRPLNTLKTLIVTGGILQGTYEFNNQLGLTKAFIGSTVDLSAGFMPFYNCSSSLELYTDAAEEPADWSASEWNYADYDHEIEFTVHYGVTEAQFRALTGGNS